MQPLHGRQHVRIPPRACRQIWRATCTTIGIQEEPDTQVQRLRICRTNQVLQGVERQTKEGERTMNVLFKLPLSLTKSKSHGGKICTKCGKFKAYKYFSKDRARKDGYRSSCKQCDKKQQHDIRQNMSYIEVEEKQCSECGRILPIRRFGIDKTKKDGHRSYCLECMSEQQKHRRRIKLVKQPTSKL